MLRRRRRRGDGNGRWGLKRWGNATTNRTRGARRKVEGNNTMLGDHAWLGNDATLGRHASLDDDATHGDHASLGDDAALGDDMTAAEKADRDGVDDRSSVEVVRVVVVPQLGGREGRRRRSDNTQDR